MKVKNDIEIILDKNGLAIKAGDTIKIKFFVRTREHPGRKMVGIGSYGKDVTISDEGELGDASEHWITKKVGWIGACLCAEELERSSIISFSHGEIFDKDGNKIWVNTNEIEYINSCFSSSSYEIIRN